MSTRRALPPRRNLITKKVRIAGQRTHYISVHDDLLDDVFFGGGPECGSIGCAVFEVWEDVVGYAASFTHRDPRGNAGSDLDDLQARRGLLQVGVAIHAP